MYDDPKTRLRGSLQVGHRIILRVQVDMITEPGAVQYTIWLFNIAMEKHHF